MIPGVYCADLLHKPHIAIKEKCQGKFTQVHLLVHDNAPTHGSHVGQTTILKCRLEEVRHTPYSVDLALSDYKLASNLKTD